MIGASLVSVLSAVSAHAGAGFSHAGPEAFAAASSAATSEAHGDLVNFGSQALANTFAKVNPSGVWASAFAGTDGGTFIVGEAEFNQLSQTRAKVYQKGSAVMAKARADVMTTIVINGVAHIVSIEVARALSRATPIGASAAADAHSLISASSSGYLGVISGTQSEATVRTQN